MKRTRQQAGLPTKASRAPFKKPRLLGPSVRGIVGPQRGAALTSRQVGEEVKSLDVPLGTLLCNTTAAFAAVNLIRIGSTFCNRIGRKIQMKSLEIRGQMIPIRTVAATDYVRVMVIYDRQTNGALPAIADILQDTDQAAANTTNSSSGMNLNNRDRFIMLRDWKLCLPGFTDTAGQISTLGPVDPVSPTFNIKAYIKLKGLVTQFKSDSAPAVIGDIASGGLYIVTFGANASASEGWSLELATRLRFKG